MESFLITLIVTMYALVDSTIVNTTYGPVEGAVVGNMTAFINIPFAKPPVDSLRFASPEPPEAWNETLDVSDMNATAWCIQSAIWTTIDNTNEDCLYLNVFTPSDAAYNTTSYQVMVWIHGGGFVAGSKDQYDPQYFIQHTQDLIIVVINYRLGIFGFLYDSDYGTGCVPL